MTTALRTDKQKVALCEGRYEAGIPNKKFRPMENSKKSMYFQLVRGKLSPSKSVFLAILAFVITPTHPFKAEKSHWIELGNRHETTKDASELLRIYSVVKPQMTRSKDAWAWEISSTILEESRRHSLDPMLVLAVINVESRFQSKAVSTEGARGLMQIRPIVAHALLEELGSRDQGIKGSRENLFDPSTLRPFNLDDPVLNIKLGVFYLRSLKEDFRDLKLALTAYNWGPTAVKNRLQEDEVLPFDYASKVLSAYQNYRKDSRQKLIP